MTTETAAVGALSRLSARAVRAAARRSFLVAKTTYKLGLADPKRARPVIVYTVGKVGSTSVAATLESALEGRAVNHVHWLAADNLRADEAHYRSRARECRGKSQLWRFMPRYVWLGQHLNAAISSAPSGTTWDVVTLVRDPVCRNVSSFFQNLEVMFDFWPAEELKTRSPQEVATRLVELFLDTYVAGNSPVEHDGNPLTWFDIELKPVFGVDVYATPFPVSSGYHVYTSANARVLLLRLEDLDRVGPRAFSEFLGVSVGDVVQSNEATGKAYADVYGWFQKLLKLPGQYVDRIYSSRYSKHFYTPAELDKFRSRWQSVRSSLGCWWFGGGILATDVLRFAEL